MARIDDAVTRILRVKHRAGLWDKPSPADREGAGQRDTLGSRDHRELAREAVRRSLVLLKNDQILPLDARPRSWWSGAVPMISETDRWLVADLAG